MNVIACLVEAESMRQTRTVCAALTGLFGLHHLFCSGLHHGRTREQPRRCRDTAAANEAWRGSS